jgi:hypothetical protein
MVHPEVMAKEDGVVMRLMLCGAIYQVKYKDTFTFNAGQIITVLSLLIFLLFSIVSRKLQNRNAR